MIVVEPGEIVIVVIIIVPPQPVIVIAPSPLNGSSTSQHVANILVPSYQVRQQSVVVVPARTDANPKSFVSRKVPLLRHVKNAGCLRVARLALVSGQRAPYKIVLLDHRLELGEHVLAQVAVDLLVAELQSLDQGAVSTHVPIVVVCSLHRNVEVFAWLVVVTHTETRHCGFDWIGLD